MSRLGVISDTHDNLDRVREAVEFFNRAGVAHVVHCGDIVAQFVLGEFGRLAAPVTLVYGNCDGDRASLAARAGELGFSISDGPRELVLGGRRIVVSHRPLEPAPDCDYYLCGHTHRAGHTPGRPVVINPGECGGWLTGRSTVAVLDTDTGEVGIHELGAGG